MRRLAAPALALAVTLTVVAAAPALASTYRGTAIDDKAMPVKLKLSGSDVIFEYSDVLVSCSDGSELRQGGASHSDSLSDRGKFKDRLELEGTTSIVKGKVREKKAVGTITYDLLYAGGACHSGKLKWKAKRK